MDSTPHDYTLRRIVTGLIVLLYVPLVVFNEVLDHVLRIDGMFKQKQVN